MKPSSFQRKSNPMESIPGCYKSSYTHHILTSTGVPQLDFLIGGGMPIGTLLVIEEDYAGSYAKLLTKYFLAEGVYNGHSTCFSTLQQNPRSIIQNLPSLEEKEEKSMEKSATDSKEQLNIAWRYANKTLESSDLGGAKGRSFNLNIPIPSDTLEKADIEAVSIDDQEEKKTTQLLKKFHQTCKTKEFLINPGTQIKKSNLIRLGVLSLGDILWGEDITSISTFLLAFRALLRNCMGVGIVTLPSSIHEKEGGVNNMISSIGDFVINLTAFDAQENVSPVYKDYHGIIKVKRIASLGVLTPPPHLLKDDNELVFKSRRTKFEIEKFHLPPDLSVTASRDQKDPKVKKNIDF
eukprot:TRINITY_DN10130_c0_g1_i8.p1 TRINITY_DN10130_c0_g1~~TRINITY_DN10130_c0_g1_i8.p1  ORF type:complete len:351 (+),score=59.29 TRINITY_DN10130_c0_g1_i8:43-1095(+)